MPFAADLFLRTYVVARLPAPETKADCRGGAWRNRADEEGAAFPTRNSVWPSFTSKSARVERAVVNPNTAG
jgi:hypothetical protein